MTTQTSFSNFFIFQIATLLFCGAVASDLFGYFFECPIWLYLKGGDRGLYLFSDFAFCVWLIPLIQQFSFSLKQRHFPPSTLLLSLIAITFSTLSTMTSIRFFAHLGFASSCAAFHPLTTAAWLWLFGAISWMPAIVWLSMKLGLAGLDPLIRIALATLTTSLLLYSKREIGYESV